MRPAAYAPEELGPRTRTRVMLTCRSVYSAFNVCLTNALDARYSADPAQPVSTPTQPLSDTKTRADAPSIVNVRGNGAGSGCGGVYFRRIWRL